MRLPGHLCVLWRLISWLLGLDLIMVVVDCVSACGSITNLCSLNKPSAEAVWGVLEDDLICSNIVSTLV